jgi:hypothetical protein
MVPQGRQVPTHPGFVGGAERYDCGACIAYHAREWQFPLLAGLSIHAWDLFALLQDQQRAGGMDVIGLDYTVLPFVFDLYDVPAGKPRRRLFERIVWINHAVAAHRAEQRDLEAQRAKATGRR